MCEVFRVREAFIKIDAGCVGVGERVRPDRFSRVPGELEALLLRCQVCMETTLSAGRNGDCAYVLWRSRNSDRNKSGEWLLIHVRFALNEELIVRRGGDEQFVGAGGESDVVGRFD